MLNLMQVYCCTTVPNVVFPPLGLLLYHGGRADDFLAVELVNGFIHFLVNDGAGIRVLAARTTRPVRYQNQLDRLSLRTIIVKRLALLSI